MLKKCPWCKSEAEYVMKPLWNEYSHRGYYGNYDHYIQCTNQECRAIAPNGIIDDVYRSPEEAKEKAIKIWNTRGKKEDK